MHHSFGAADSTDTASFIERATMLQPTPPDSDDGFERIRKQPEQAGGGSDEDYDMVRKDEGDAASGEGGEEQEEPTAVGRDDVSMDTEETAAADPA